MTTVLYVGGLVDVEAGRVVRDAYIQVTDDRIGGWGTQRDKPPLPPDASELWLADGFALPGLINSHAHLCTPAGGQPFHLRQSDQTALLTAVRNMGLERQSGVTTVRDCGDQNGVLFALRQAVAAGILQGPRLLLCGPPLTMTGGHAHFLGGTADGTDGVVCAVRQRIAAGADFIKLIATGGGTPGTHPGYASYSREELAAAVATASRVNIPVTAHCRGVPGMVNALAAGVDQIEHACFEHPDGSLRFDAQLADAMARRGVYVTPTIQLYRDMHTHLRQKSALQALSPDETEQLRRLPATIEAKYLALQGLLAAGVPCVAGNDAGLPYTGFGVLWQELDAMVAAGMSPMQAITAATLTAARALRLADAIGSIREGKQADLLIVDGDPTHDVRALAKVRLVMQGGAIISRPPGP